MPGAFAATALEETRALEQLASRHPRQAIEQGQAQLQRARETGDRPGQLRALRQLLLAYDEVDDTPGLRATSNQGLALAHELSDAAAQAEFMAGTATVAYNEGRNDASLSLYDRAVAFAEGAKLEREAAKICIGKAHTLHGMERDPEALALLLKAYAIFEGLGDKLWMANALSEVANIYASDNASPQEIERAISYHQRALDLLDPRSNRYGLSTHLYNIGVAYTRIKDYAHAKQHLDRALAVARELKEPHTVAFVQYRLGVIAEDEKRPEEAIAFLDQALPVFVTTEKVPMQFMTQTARARALATLGRKKESLAALATAEPLWRRIGSSRRETHYYEAAAFVHASLGDYQKAYEALGSLREADRRVASAGHARMVSELQARFETRERETENMLLRIERHEDDTRRFLFALALSLTVMVVMLLTFYVVRQTRQNRRFANLAMRDDLTGLPNRRSILEFAQMQFNGRRETDKGFCLALIDLDHFKEVNDKFGHSVGDAVLAEFARACLKNMRTQDRFGRFGGEEFMLVMPHSDSTQVAGVFERLREGVARIDSPGYFAAHPITFSMGATEARASDAILDAVIKRADEALYRAKNAGRNRLETN